MPMNSTSGANCLTPAISAKAIAGLATEDIPALSSAQVRALKAEQVAAMNTAQVEAISQAYKTV